MKPEYCQVTIYVRVWPQIWNWIINQSQTGSVWILPYSSLPIDQRWILFMTLQHLHAFICTYIVFWYNGMHAFVYFRVQLTKTTQIVLSSTKTQIYHFMIWLIVVWLCFWDGLLPQLPCSLSPIPRGMVDARSKHHNAHKCWQLCYILDTYSWLVMSRCLLFRTADLAQK